MANKTQLATAGEQQAAIVINNSFIDGLVKQLEEKCLTFYQFFMYLCNLNYFKKYKLINYDRKFEFWPSFRSFKEWR